MAADAWTHGIAKFLRSLSIVILSLASIALVGLTIACALGFVPWLTLPLTFGDFVVADAGMYIQIAVAVLVTSLLHMVPTNSRIMNLEKSHRDFQISMDDVAQAYYICHTADRAGAFTMSAQFDAVRERLLYLREHPDLGRLEAGVLEVAAQMSQQSQHLAEVYSDDSLARARGFLRQRQEEADTHLENIRVAMTACDEIERWTAEIESREGLLQEQSEELEEKCRAVLTPLGYDVVRDEPKRGENVLSIGGLQPAE